MHSEKLNRWRHDHTFGQERKRVGESRTLVVIAITAAMMLVEVVAGLLFGSMALLADGLHMASHAAALSINAFAYAYARGRADDVRYCFGTGKVNALGGFTGAVLLAVFALLMVWESTIRLIRPVAIVFNQAILVAAFGLAVNAICVFILQAGRGGRHDGEQNHDHDHPHGHDHNLESAYLHVMADALTSILAIVALLAAKYVGAVWMDPTMGIVGAVLVARWSLGLLRTTGGVLLDRQGPQAIRDEIRKRIEEDDDSRVTDLHLWSIGQGIYAVVIAVVAHGPATPERYKARLPKNLGLAHVSIEVSACAAAAGGEANSSVRSQPC